ncbi:recombination regulator RecX [Stutzerimonas tarimensis]|uniref:Regulatory protein RecX n=1 Tax=Stutzerimonas tarimensis TaxID=1507735 RepID=A0ABV7T7L8_9GAMM
MPVILDSPAAVRRAAMDLLARREHARAELSRKLRQRGAPPELIDPTLERLADEGLLSETRYLESFIRRKAMAGCGPLRIREELSHTGIPRDTIEQALRDSDFDWSEQLREVWQRKFAASRPQDARERARQARFLAYRGFPAELISRLWRS